MDQRMPVSRLNKPLTVSIRSVHAFPVMLRVPDCLDKTS
ncbi:unnamed protein product [Penicillium camemberti]|uniref:Str. FM013 n=1 Tax=Penicillium camemberti (strain FM 013) TaxID=1429867 RepID=A0A0G4P9D9_PENC3|nr:unnamed protein product [Penicillium camemberti]